MAIIEKGFEVNGEPVVLTHNIEDDSRSVVDSDGDVLLMFTCSLDVLNSTGEKIAKLNAQNSAWALTRYDRETDVILGAHRDYHWQALVDCEVRAAQILLTR
jgi:hypothetical protein